MGYERTLCPSLVYNSSEASRAHPSQMDSSSQISDLIFSNKTAQSTLNALIRLFTLHLCVLGEMGTKEGFIRPCCGWPVQLLGMLQGNWESSVPTHTGPSSVLRHPAQSPTSLDLLSEPQFTLHSYYPWMKSFLR